MPVLFTVPVSVIRVVSSITPPYCALERLRNVFSLSAGLDVFISAIQFFSFRNSGQAFRQERLSKTLVSASSLDQGDGSISRMPDKTGALGFVLKMIHAA
jgi:hypothetical protein